MHWRSLRRTPMTCPGSKRWRSCCLLTCLQQLEHYRGSATFEELRFRLLAWRSLENPHFLRRYFWFSLHFRQRIAKASSPTNCSRQGRYWRTLEFLNYLQLSLSWVVSICCHDRVRTSLWVPPIAFGSHLSRKANFYLFGWLLSTGRR